MPGRIILTAGRNTDDRITTARTIARENHWPLLDVNDMTSTLARHIVGDATGDPDSRTSCLFKTIVEPAQRQALLNTVWAQVDAGVPGVVVSAPLISELAIPEWLNELNYDLGLQGYEATVVYVLADGELAPELDPEHYALEVPAKVEDLFAAATRVAINVRGE